MPTGRHTQASFGSGEFDRLLWSREELSYFYSSARIIENATPMPQGGAKRGEGLRFASLQRGNISVGLDFTDTGGLTLSAPNGGIAVDAWSPVEITQMITTTAIGTATEYVIFGFDAGTATRVSLADINFRLVDNGGGQDECTLSLQSSDDGIAYTTRASITVGRTRYIRRFGDAPNTDLGSHRYWRVILDNPLGLDFGLDVMQGNGFRTLQEANYSLGSTVGSSQLRRLTLSAEKEFWIIVTDENADVFASDGTWLAAVWISHTNSQVPAISFAQQRDTLVLYHPDVPTSIVQRLGSDTEWRGDFFQFSSVPQFAYDDSASGGQNEIQELQFNSVAAGNRIAFEYNGEVSAEIAWSATAATNEANITGAIEGLPDITSVTVTAVTGNTNFRVEFDGVDGNRPFATLIILVLDGSGTATVKRTQYGKPNQEDLWSVARGYPSCGTFFGSRHWVGGVPGAPDVFAASRVSDLFDFKEDADPVASSPILGQLNVDEEVDIVAFFAGRNLQMFTSQGEFFWPDNPITPDNVTGIQEASQNGHSEFTQPVGVQGATFFVDRNGSAIREFLFSELQQSYTAEPISTFAPHLVKQPTSLAYRRASSEDDPPLLYLVNTGRDREGALTPMAIATINRGQEVTAFARRVTTLGTFRDVATTSAGGAGVIVERELAGVPWKYFEIFDADHLGDCSIEITNPDAEAFTAGPAQTIFTYTFTSPVTVEEVGVWTQANPGDPYVIVEPEDYTVDLGLKRVTFDTAPEEGVLVYIAPRQQSATLGTGILDGIECFAHVDGLPSSAVTPAAGAISLGDDGFFFNVRVGLRMVPRIVLHPYKGRGDNSPTMRKQRIFRCLLQLERSLNVAIAVEGRSPRQVTLVNLDGAVPFDAELSELLFTGPVRVSGLSGWQTEPRLVITQNTPGPWGIRSATYDVRF